ncbi:MAG: hypothetical protein ACT4P3_12395 [Betaproteobacteria bacterium]
MNALEAAALIGASISSCRAGSSASRSFDRIVPKRRAGERELFLEPGLVYVTD